MVSREDVNAIITRVANAWNESQPKDKVLWVVGANPGDWVSIPCERFRSEDKPAAGMATTVNLQGYVIAINPAMVPESLLSTFFHELGHVKYLHAHGSNLDTIESERWAVRCSLESLESLGYPELAYREADSVKNMAKDEPYKSAVDLLKDDALWLKYSQTPRA